MRSVTVVLHPVGEFIAPLCHVDQFTAGELTITDRFDQVLCVIHAGDWLSVTAYDDTGHPSAYFSSALLDARIQEAAKGYNAKWVA